MNDFSENIRNIRTVMGMSVDSIAAMTGISRQTVSKYERNCIWADLSYLLWICHRMCIPLGSLVLLSPEDFVDMLKVYSGLNEKEKVLIRDYRKLSFFHKGYLTEIVRKGSEAVGKEYDRRFGQETKDPPIRRGAQPL